MKSYGNHTGGGGTNVRSMPKVGNRGYSHKGTQGSGQVTPKARGTQGTGTCSHKAKGVQGRGV